MPGVKFADYNDLDSVKKRITDKTCAILFETVQGEGGIYPALTVQTVPDNVYFR